MNNIDECQILINEIVSNPSILNLIPYEIFLLKFLKLTGHNEIRKLMIDNKNFDILPLNYITKILDKLKYKYMHLIKIKKEYYITNDIYDYVISDDNNITAVILDKFSKLKYDDKGTNELFDKNIKLVLSNFDILVVQNQLLETESELLSDLFLKDDNEFRLNLRNYTIDNFDSINGNSYTREIIVANNRNIYFKSKGELYEYNKESSTIEKYNAKVNKSEIIPVLSIYLREQHKD